jgi:ATP-dependent protease Clp ATPase subunit
MIAYSTERFVTEAIDCNIYTIFLVPHSSAQCQLLDLVTYGLIKRFISSWPLTLLRSRQSQKLVRMLEAWHQAASPHQFVSAFTAMGLVLFLGEDNVLYMRVDRGQTTRGGQDPEPLEFGRCRGRIIRFLIE